MKFRIQVFVVSLLFAVACFAANEPERSPSAEGAKVGFANLSDGDVVLPLFKVRFVISGMGIAPAGVQIDGTGHHHLLIDTPELPDFTQPLPFTANIMHFEKSESEVELKLPEGQHTLQLLLADFEQVPHEPPVLSDPITITVSANAPPPVKTEQE
jgi:hypothetical protein